MDRSVLGPSPVKSVVQTRTVLGFGLLLGAALGIGLGWWVISDRQNRLQAAERQSQALVVGVERAIGLELRNLERAMRGIAADATALLASAPDRAPGLIGQLIKGVASRHHELESVVMVDAQGRALTPGRGDPSFHSGRPVRPQAPRTACSWGRCSGWKTAARCCRWPCR